MSEMEPCDSGTSGMEPAELDTSPLCPYCGKRLIWPHVYKESTELISEGTVINWLHIQHPNGNISMQPKPVDVTTLPLYYWCYGGGDITVRV